MKKNSFLLFAFLLSLFAIFSCGGGGGGGGSSDSSGVLTNLPPGGLQWTLNDSGLPIAGRPAFDGQTFAALGAVPISDLDRTYQTHIYESQDGVTWEDTTSFQGQSRAIFDRYKQLTSFPNQLYLDLHLSAYGLSRSFLERQEKGKWLVRQRNSVLMDNVTGPNNNAKGPYYQNYYFEKMFVSREDTTGQSLTYEIDSNYRSYSSPEYSQNGTDITLTDSKALKLMRGETKDGKFTKTFLLEAPLGKTHFTQVKNFPDTQEKAMGGSETADHIDYNRNLYSAYGNSLLLAGIGSQSQAPPGESVSGYGMKFYRSDKGLAAWQEVAGLSKFTKNYAGAWDIPKYELGGISYVQGLFIVFINERSDYLESASTRPGESSIYNYNDIACYVLTSTNLVDFQEKRFQGIRCLISDAFYAKGRLILSALKEDGRGSSGEKTYRLVTISAPVP